VFPSSIYLGAANGRLTHTVYTPATNTNSAGYIEGIGVVASLAQDSVATLQFNLPAAIPSGTCKLRLLAFAGATGGTAKLTIADGVTAVGSNIGAATLTSETQTSQTWSSADVIVEIKTALSVAPVASNVYTVKITFQTGSWTLAANSVWQASLIWE
jgi:hypothetical protein